MCHDLQQVQGSCPHSGVRGCLRTAHHQQHIQALQACLAAAHGLLLQHRAQGSQRQLQGIATECSPAGTRLGVQDLGHDGERETGANCKGDCHCKPLQGQGDGDKLESGVTTRVHPLKAALQARQVLMKADIRGGEEVASSSKTLQTGLPSEAPTRQAAL